MPSPNDVETENPDPHAHWQSSHTYGMSKSQSAVGQAAYGKLAPAELYGQY